MRMNKWLLALSMVLIMTVGCQNDTAKLTKSSPKKCQTCDGTGKVQKSEEVPLAFQILDYQVNDHGFINPDYYAEITLENKSDEDGTFTVFADFEYKGIGTHTEKAELFVKAHSKSTKQIHYDADKRCDTSKCRVEAPMTIHTSESICPVCKGNGLTGI